MKRILIIEDDESFSRILEFYLLKQGYSVFRSSSGLEALACLRGGELADLIILDLQLPDIEGLRLMELIKENCDVPIVINSGYSQYKSDFGSWLADAYLVKNSDLNELGETIRTVLGSNVISRNRGSGRNGHEEDTFSR